MGIIKRQSLKSIIVNYVGVGLGAVFLLIIFPNIIDKSYLGFIQFLLGLTLVFAQLVCVGTQSVLYKFYNDWRNTHRLNDYHSLALRIMLLAFVVFSFFFIVFKSQILGVFAKEKSPLVTNYYLVLLPLILIQAFTFYLEFYSIMRLRVAVPTFLREVLNRILLIAILFLLAYKVIGDTQFVIMYVLVYTISLLVLAYYAMRYFEFRFGTWRNFFKNNLRQKEQFSYGVSSEVIAFIGNVHAFVDTIMLPVLMDLGSLGIYARPLILGQMIHVPYRSIANISAPIIMDAWDRNDVKKIADLNKKISATLLLIGLFLFSLIVVNADNFFNLLPAEYAISKNVLFIIAFGRLVDMSFGLNSEILFSSKYYKMTVYFTVVMVGIAIGLNLLLIPKVGMVGAAIAVAVSLIVFNILKATFIYKKFHFHCFSKTYLPLILIAAVAISVTYMIPDIASNYLNEKFNSTIASVALNAIYKSSIVSVLFLAPTLLLRLAPDLNDFVRLIVSGKIFKGGHKMDEL